MAGGAARKHQPSKERIKKRHGQLEGDILCEDAPQLVAPSAASKQRDKVTSEERIASASSGVTSFHKDAPRQGETSFHKDAPREKVQTSSAMAAEARSMEEATTSSHEGAPEEHEVTVAGEPSATRSVVENEPSSAGGQQGTEPVVAGDTTHFSGGVQRPCAFHPSHVLMHAAQYVFCALCGTYGRQVRRTKLHLACPRALRNRWAFL